MRISLNWLKDYLPGLNTGDIDSLAGRMIDAGLDIESIHNESEIFRGFVVGKVISKIKHPNADKLSLCKVDAGGKELSIVCGAPNVAEGQKVCVALTGTVIPNGGFEIKKSKIRGEVSEGMICSESELNLSDNHDGIMVLDESATPGMSFSEYAGLNDVIMEIGVTPNRGDLLSHFGVARDVGAAYGIKPELPEIDLVEEGPVSADLISISIESRDFCKRFTGRVIMDVRIGESPEWLKNRLIAAGVRPRNNVVDITNYVMLETGQPLHAFDYDKIRGRKIIVRTAKDGDKFTTLDAKERVLSAESLMVCDGEGYSAIAGVMGGEYSEITEETVNVFLESAYFDPVNIRKNSKRLGLITDASQRFERGVDIDMVKYASLRASALMREFAQGKVSKGLLDVYPEPFTPLEAGMRISKAGKLLGMDIDGRTCIDLLSLIGVDYQRTEGEYMIFRIPESRRNDISREPDLIEETARLFGYHNISPKYEFTIDTMRYKDRGSESMNALKSEIAKHFIGRGFNEIMTVPIVDLKQTAESGLRPVRLVNSLTAELNTMRTDLVAGMMKSVSLNFNNLGKDVSLRLFETGRVFEDNGISFSEREMLIAALAGKADGGEFYTGGRDFDFFDMKGEAGMLLSKLNLETIGLFYYNDNQFDRSEIDVCLRDAVLGKIYKADKSLLDQYDIRQDVFLLSMDLGKLLEMSLPVQTYSPISRYPSVKRDIALVVDRKTDFGVLSKALTESGGKLLRSSELIDIYEGDQIGKGKKSVAFSLVFASDDKTLTDLEVSNALDGILKKLNSLTGSELRS